jgi:hypothetical protein
MIGVASEAPMGWLPNRLPAEGWLGFRSRCQPAGASPPHLHRHWRPARPAGRPRTAPSPPGAVWTGSARPRTPGSATCPCTASPRTTGNVSSGDEVILLVARTAPHPRSRRGSCARVVPLAREQDLFVKARLSLGKVKVKRRLGGGVGLVGRAGTARYRGVSAWTQVRRCLRGRGSSHRCQRPWGVRRLHLALDWVATMMTISVRDTCRALGFGQTVSLCTDVLGFTRGHCPGRLGPTRPDTAFSIRSFVHGLRRAHFHVRLLIAGTDVITSNDWRVLEYAVYRLRDIYTTNGIGVGRITFAGFTAAMSLGHDVVTSDTELPTTGHDLTENGDFIPVVLPASMNVTTVNPDGSVTVTLGLSPVPGPCSPR